jgi:hypothetical protein
MKTQNKIIDLLEKIYYKGDIDNILNENSVESISEIGGIGAGIGGRPSVQQTRMPMPEPQTKKTPGLEKILDLITTEDSESPVRIPPPEELGLGLDEPIEKFKNQITSGKKPWDKLSKELNTLYIYNKDKHSDVAAKAKNKRESLASWVEGKRAKNSDFGK